MYVITTLRGQLLSMMGRTEAYIEQAQDYLRAAPQDARARWEYGVISGERYVNIARTQLQHAKTTLDGVLSGESDFTIEMPTPPWNTAAIHDERTRSIVQSVLSPQEEGNAGNEPSRERLLAEADRLLSKWDKQQTNSDHIARDDERYNNYWLTFIDLCHVLSAMAKLQMHDDVDAIIARDDFKKHLYNWISNLGLPHLILAESLIEGGMVTQARQVLLDGVTMLRDTELGEALHRQSYTLVYDHTEVAYAMAQMTKLAIRMEDYDLISELREAIKGFNVFIYDQVIPANFVAKELYEAGRHEVAETIFEESITAAGTADYYDELIRATVHTAVIMYTVGLPLDLPRLENQIKGAVTMVEEDMEGLTENREALVAHGLATLCELAAYRYFHEE